MVSIYVYDDITELYIRLRINTCTAGKLVIHTEYFNYICRSSSAVHVILKRVEA